MTRFLIKSLFLITIAFSISAKAQGIRFNSNDNLITDRTSYNVFAHNQPKFEGNFNIDFNVSIINPDVFGYVFYIKDKNNSISYSLAYVSRDENFGEFKLNLDGVKTVHTVPLKKELLGARKWIKISLNFNSTSTKIKPFQSMRIL